MEEERGGCRMPKANLLHYLTVLQPLVAQFSKEKDGKGINEFLTNLRNML